MLAIFSLRLMDPRKYLMSSKERRADMNEADLLPGSLVFGRTVNMWARGAL